MRGIINLIIAHGHPHFLVILQNIIRSYQGFRIVAKATNLADLLDKTAVHKPDVIIADIALPGIKGFTEFQKLAASCPQAKVILSWQHDHGHEIKKAMEAGCAGCIVHDANPAEYSLAVRQVMKGEVFYCNHTEKVMNAYKRDPGAVAPPAEMLSEKYGGVAVLHLAWLQQQRNGHSHGTQ
jgi:DNA-binding NarL/FixJ family response regulator